MSMTVKANAVSFRLYGASLTGRAPILALVTRSAGTRLVKTGKAEEGIDVDGRTPCFRMVDVRPVAAKPLGLREANICADAVKVDSKESCTAFSMGEVEAVAGRCFRDGRSRTARMSEEQKFARVERIARLDVLGRRPKHEDAVERAVNKYDAWSQIGGMLDLVREITVA